MLNDTAASLLRRVDLALLSNKQRVRRGTERQSSAHRATAAP
jgi:hypothetical protein